MCVMRPGQADRVPLWNLWRARALPFRYENQIERAQAVLALGLDDILLLQPPFSKTDITRPGVWPRFRKRFGKSGLLTSTIRDWSKPMLPRLGSCARW
jgi:hypothetical protein